MSEVMERPREYAGPRLLASKFLPNEFAFGRFSAVIPVGVTIDDVLKPEFWAHIAHMLRSNQMTGDPARTGTIIEIRSEDHSLYAELYVRAVKEQALDVALIGKPTYFGPRESSPSEKYSVRWNVGKRGFDILRKSDNAIIGRAVDFPKKEDAYEHIRRLGA